MLARAQERKRVTVGLHHKVDEHGEMSKTTYCSQAQKQSHA